MFAAVGIHYHLLPLLYLGYGVLGGAGVGLAYTPPVQTLMQWFPDKKGFASGLTAAGYASGALLFIPVVQQLMSQFRRLPTYLGPPDSIQTAVVNGKLFAIVDGNTVEVVEALTSDISKLPVEISEGLYIVGTGSTGAASALAVMGATYFSILMASAFAMKKPCSSFGVTDTISGHITPLKSDLMEIDIPPDKLIKMPQFHLLGLSLFCITTSGMVMLSVAKPMISEVYYFYLDYV